MLTKPVFPRKPPVDFVYKPPNSALDLIYEDARLLVFSKPNGLLSVPGRKEEHQDSFEVRVKQEYPEARIVHRLDMETSGLMVMALDAETHRHIGLQFEKRKTEKTYIARVWGHMKQEKGVVDLPLICDWPNRPLQMVDHENGRVAHTHWEVIEQEDNASRLLLTPITGRTHQLRVHMAEIGHPILGDDFYAHEEAFYAASRLQLHAEKLSLHHPEDGRWMTFEAPCPF